MFMSRFFNSRKNLIIAANEAVKKYQNIEKPLRNSGGVKLNLKVLFYGGFCRAADERFAC